MRSEADLRDAQQRTADYLYENDAAQAVLPMGAGKTASALTAFRDLKRDGHVYDMFVLAPKRVAQLVWKDETQEWAHLCNIKVVFVGGTAAQRAQALRTPADIYTVGIDNTQWLVEWLDSQPAERFSRTVFCIDESSRFKNPRGKRGKALFSYLYRNQEAFFSIWDLTGTSRPNGYEDQFMPLKIATRGKLWGKSFDQWRQRYFFPTDYNGYNWQVHPELEHKLIADINTVTITLRPEDMPDMPELNDGPEFIRWVEMPRDVEAVYKRMKRHLVAELKKADQTVAAANMAVASGKLSQIAQGFLYENAEDEKAGRGAERLHSLKMDALKELIEEAGGEAVAIAYDFQEDLRFLRTEFPGLRYLGAGVKDSEAAETINMWNTGAIDKLALHPASAGHGLNLQFGGRQLIHYGMTWSAELYDQLLKRFHRPGQALPVFSRPILMRGTVDELKYDRVRQKMSAQAAFQRFLKEV
jgi:SNF2 family DNA or RNA helicase